MATEKKTGTTRRRSTTTLKTWSTRALLALVAGASIGAGAGVMTVNKLEPGRGTGVDSLAVMLDSIARGKVPTGGAAKDEAQSEKSAAPADSAVAPAAELIAVPALTDMEEGAARTALLDAGLQVGEVQFQASPKPAGTVLSSIPIAGSNVAPNTPVTLVLSDGRTSTTDTLSTPFAKPAP
jgi:serine/threonine-protein kinase